MGGLYSVRGYSESDSAGDAGVLMTAEYRYHVPRAFAIATQGRPGPVWRRIIDHWSEWVGKDIYQEIVDAQPSRSS